MDVIAGVCGAGDKDILAKTSLATGVCQHRGKASTGFYKMKNKKRNIKDAL